jgi:O-antigen ligase
MRKATVALTLVAIPLAVVPFAVTFDAAKAALLSLDALGLVAAALPARTPEGPGRLDFRWSPVTVAIFAALLLFAAAAPHATDPWAAGRSLALLLAAAVFALAVENTVFDAADLEGIAFVTPWVLVAVAGYGLIQSAGYDFPFPWNEGRRPVPASTLGNPNFAAEWVAAAIPFVFLARRRAEGWTRFMALPAFWLGMSFLVLSGGRAAWLGLVCGFGAMMALFVGREPGLRRMMGAYLGGAGLVFLLGTWAWVVAEGPALPSSVGRTDTILVRAELARGTLSLIGDHPLGVGPGNWEVAHPPYRTEAEYRASLFRDPGEAHCDPLQFAAEGGIPAFLGILILLVVLGAAALRAVRGEHRPLAGACFASLAATLAISLVSSPFRRPASLLLAAFAAGALSFLGGGRVTTLGTGGRWLHRLLVLLLAAGTGLLGLTMAAEGPAAAARRIEQESDPLSPARAAAAREDFTNAASLDPGAVDPRARIGEISVKLAAVAPDPAALRSECGRAVDAYSAALALRPRDPMLLSGLALARSGLGEDAAAEALWKEALALQPWHRNANQAYAYFLVARNRPAEALPPVERALSVDPTWHRAVSTRVAALLACDRQAEALEAASNGIDRILAGPARDLAGAAEVAARAARADPALAAMALGKGTRLLAGPDREGGRALVVAVADARPEEDLLESGAKALAAGNYPGEASLLRVRARFAAADAFLAAGEREKAAAETRRALEVTMSTETKKAASIHGAGLFVRAGFREEALAALGEAVARRYGDADALLADPALAPLREDRAFRALVERARKNAARGAEK